MGYTGIGHGVGQSVREIVVGAFVRYVCVHRTRQPDRGVLCGLFAQPPVGVSQFCQQGGILQPSDKKFPGVNQYH